MARIGLDNFRYGIFAGEQNGEPVYGTGKKPGKAISASVSISNNDAKLYADNVVAETDTSFASGTVTFGIDNFDLTTQSDMLGHTLEDGEMVLNSNDIAPYIGFGRIVTLMVDGERKYKAQFIFKAKMSEPSSDENTKGESIEFGTTEIEGQIATLTDGRVTATKVFTTHADAAAWLDSFFGTAPTTYTITYNANGGTGSVDPVSVPVGTSVELSDGTGLTAPENTTFTGWAKTPTATVPTVTSPFTPTDDTTLYAVYEADGEA